MYHIVCVCVCERERWEFRIEKREFDEREYGTQKYVCIKIDYLVDGSCYLIRQWFSTFFSWQQTLHVLFWKVHLKSGNLKNIFIKSCKIPVNFMLLVFNLLLKIRQKYLGGTSWRSVSRGIPVEKHCNTVSFGIRARVIDQQNKLFVMTS